MIGPEDQPVISSLFLGVLVEVQPLSYGGAVFHEPDSTTSNDPTKSCGLDLGGVYHLLVTRNVYKGGSHSPNHQSNSRFKVFSAERTQPTTPMISRSNETTRTTASEKFMRCCSCTTHTSYHYLYCPREGQSYLAPNPVTYLQRDECSQSHPLLQQFGHRRKPVGSTVGHRCWLLLLRLLYPDRQLLLHPHFVPLYRCGLRR